MHNDIVKMNTILKINTKEFKRYFIIGNGGSGKSTLARFISNKKQIDITHTDFLYWNEGWIMPTQQQFLALDRQLTSKNFWIIEGAKLDLLNYKAKEADLIISSKLLRLAEIVSLNSN